MFLHKKTLHLALLLCSLAGTAFFAHAETLMSDREAVQAGVKTEIAKDLSQPYTPLETLSGRTCLDGRPVDGFEGDILEDGSNLEWCAV